MENINKSSTCGFGIITVSPINFTARNDIEEVKKGLFSIKEKQAIENGDFKKLKIKGTVLF